MARLAATEHGADWVINGDADEFWWPRGGSLPEVLAAVPRRYGIAQSFVRHFVPVADDGRPFQERMTLRLSPTAPINDPASPWRPYRKVVHRASPDDRARRGRPRRPLGRPPAATRAGTRSSASTSRSGRRAQVERKGRAWGDAVEKFYASQSVAAGTGNRLPRAPARGRGERRRRGVLRLARGLAPTWPRGPRRRAARRGHASSATRSESSPTGARRAFPRPSTLDDRVVRRRGRRARRGRRRPHPALARRPRAAARGRSSDASRTGPSARCAGSCAAGSDEGRPHPARPRRGRHRRGEPPLPPTRSASTTSSRRIIARPTGRPRSCGGSSARDG